MKTWFKLSIGILGTLSVLAQAQSTTPYYIQSYNSGLFLKISGQSLTQVSQTSQPTMWMLDTSGITDGGVWIKSGYSGQCLSVNGQVRPCSQETYLHYLNPEDMAQNQDWCIACRFAITDSSRPFNQNPPQNCLTASPINKDGQQRGFSSKKCIQGGSNSDQQFRLIPVNPKSFRN